MVAVGLVVVAVGLVVVVVGCVVVVGIVVAIFCAFSKSFLRALFAFVILFCTSVLLTFLFLGGCVNPSVGAIIMHVTKSITNRNIIERIIPLLNMVVILYKTLTQ